MRHKLHTLNCKEGKTDSSTEAGANYDYVSFEWFLAMIMQLVSEKVNVLSVCQFAFLDVYSIKIDC